MAEEIKDHVEITEHSSVEPAEGENEELVEGSPSGGTEGDAGAEDAGEAEGAEGEEGNGDADATAAGGKKEQIIRRPAPVTSTPASPGANNENAGGRLEGETPTEYARRLEIDRLRGLLRKDRSDEIRGATPAQTQPVASKRESSPQEQEILKKYNPKVVEELKELFPIIASGMGFVRADELTVKSYQEKSDSVIQDWVKEHPEYEDQALWEQVKTNFQKFYKPPQNPEDYRIILNRIHQDIFNIRPVGDRGAINAGKQKIEVASHSGNSASPRVVAPSRSSTPNANGLRLDALSGFTDEEKDNIASRAG